MTTNDVQVAVVGGGIGGLATVLALQERGVAAHVFERAPALAPLGAALIVRVQSLDLLARWTDLDFYRERAVRVDRMDHLRADGEPLRTTPMIGEPGDPDWAHSAHRADLFETLQRALPAGRLHLGRETERVEQTDDDAEVVFSDGTRVRAKAVIAADGIRSVVRRQLFSNDEAVFSGMVNYRAVVPVTALGTLPNDRLRTWIRDDTAFMVLPVRGGREVAFDAVLYTDTPGSESWTTSVATADIAPHFEGYPQVVRDVLAASPQRISAFSTYDREPIDVWTRGRVALLGDAAHPMLPFQGQGANQAVQDADTLAAHLAPALAGDGDVPAALRAYQEQRKPRTDHFQAKSRHRHVEDDLVREPMTNARADATGALG